jgi:hypothetical protein
MGKRFIQQLQVLEAVIKNPLALFQYFRRYHVQQLRLRTKTRRGDPNRESPTHPANQKPDRRESPELPAAAERAVGVIEVR